MSLAWLSFHSCAVKLREWGKLKEVGGGGRITYVLWCLNCGMNRESFLKYMTLMDSGWTVALCGGGKVHLIE